MKRSTKVRICGVLGGALVLGMFTGGGAVAAVLITGADIQDESIKKVDVGAAAVGSAEVLNGSVGMTDLNADTRSRIDTPGASVMYVDRVLTATSETITPTPAPCPAGTQVITAVVLDGGTARYSAFTQHPDPAQNAWIIGMRIDEVAGGNSLTVRVVCLVP